MKLLIKLVVAAVILNAAYHVGTVVLRYYQFKDEVEKMVLFSTNLSATDLSSQILDEATKRSVPLDSDDLTVRREGLRTVAEISYSEDVEVFPRVVYPMKFDFSTEAYGLAGAPPARPSR